MGGPMTEHEELLAVLYHLRDKLELAERVPTPLSQQVRFICSFVADVIAILHKYAPTSET